MTVPTPDSWLTDSGRLPLRRPTLDDLDVVFGIHSDPRTNVHNPAGPDRDRAASRRRLDEWLEHWERYGFGYWVVETTGSTADPRSPIVGFSGIRGGLSSRAGAATIGDPWYIRSPVRASSRTRPRA